MSIGVIYILTNPSFPDYVKIGYADDVEKRLKQLNNSECIPFAFRIYATYETDERLSDKKVHSIIDKINPDLRSIEKVDGKERKREFYAMSPEDAYSIFEAMAEIHGTNDKLKIWKVSSQEQAEQETAELVSIESQKRYHSEPITLEEYLNNKNPDFVEAYKLLEKQVFESCENVITYVLPQYISWKINNVNFAEIHIQKNQIMCLTLPPRKEYKVGNRVPDSYLWSLSYRSYVSNYEEINELKDIILDSYEQRLKRK